jgi:hypothetical protein
MAVIGDNDDRLSVLADARRFFSDYFPSTDQADVDWITASFSTTAMPPYWPLGERAAALVQVYDLVVPLDSNLGLEYLRRLGRIARALLDNRDDRRNFPVDPFRGRVMPAWGAFTDNRDGKWNTDVDTSGLFTYPMAAFARRVARRSAYHAEFGATAVQMIAAVLDTYEAFRPELHFDERDAHAYFTQPAAYGQLRCRDNETCRRIRALAGKPLPYNQNLSMLRALAEVALAADGALFRQSSAATPLRVRTATEEIPLVIAKGLAFFADHLRRKTLDDGSPYFEWNREQPVDRIEDNPHGQFSLGCLAVILDVHEALNGLLARSGRAERVPRPVTFAPMANTFLRKVWRNNSLSRFVDGSGDGANKECAGWIPFSQFDPWVWRRAREAIFSSSPPALVVGNHAALLRYRRFSKMKFLTEFAGQNWLITPAATAVGEPRPLSIHDQKWMLVLSGVVIANERGDNSGNWNHETVFFMPDMAGSDAPGATSGPLNWAIGRWSIPRPPGAQGAQYLIRFSVEEWSPFAALGAVFNQGQSINSGFAVNTWRPNNFGVGTDVLTNRPVGNLFAGIKVDLAVRDHDAWLQRLSYHITLIGRIVFVNVPVS